MALKYINNATHHLSPTISSPEEAAHSITARLQSSLFITRNKAIKRRREESEDDSSDDDRANLRLPDLKLLGPRQREPWPAAGRPKRRARKRTRISGPENITNDALGDEYETEEDTENEEDILRYVAPLRGKLGPISISTRAEPIASEYSHMNGFLRTLHMNRAAHSLTASQNPKLLSNIPVSGSAVASLGHERHGEPKGIEVGQREQDSVARTYEETNRALGRLMLSRHVTPRRTRDVHSDDSSDIEESEDSQD